MWLRWLLPVFAVLALVASSVTTFAAAGVFGDAECCCPDPDACKCHDHDGDPRPAAEMKRCAGDATIVAPALTAAVLPSTPVPGQTELAITLEHDTPPRPSTRHDRPETPPF